MTLSEKRGPFPWEPTGKAVQYEGFHDSYLLTIGDDGVQNLHPRQGNTAAFYEQRSNDATAGNNGEQSLPSIRILLCTGWKPEQKAVPISRDHLNRIYTQWMLDSHILKQAIRLAEVNGREALFDYRFQNAGVIESTAASPERRVLHLALGELGTVAIACRYDLHTSALDMVVFQDGLRSTVQLLQERCNEIRAQPLRLLVALLDNEVDRIYTEADQWQTPFLSGGSEMRSYLGIRSQPISRRLSRSSGRSSLSTQPEIEVVDTFHKVNLLRYTYQNLERICQKLKAVFQKIETFQAPLSLEEQPSSMEDVESMLRRLEFVKHEMELWSRAFEVQTSYMVVLLGQRENRINQALAKASRDIAEATRRDSSAMKTISFMTLAFLPATFVSTVFSTTVFNFQNWGSVENAVASEGWWIYFVCCVLLTAVVFVTWYIWSRRASRTLEAKLEEEKLESS
jgi:hypothetical protein